MLEVAASAAARVSASDAVKYFPPANAVFFRPEVDVIPRTVFQHTQYTLEFRGGQRFRMDELQFPRTFTESVQPLLVAGSHSGRPRQLDPNIAQNSHANLLSHMR